MSLRRDNSCVERLGRSVLDSFSEVAALSTGIDIERETVVEVGCYLYRASFAIMELQKTASTPPNALQVMQSVSRKVEDAKDLLRKLQIASDQISNQELNGIVSQLQEVVNLVGQDLSSIPQAAFEDQTYAALVVSSLSQEMQVARFEVSRSPLVLPSVPEDVPEPNSDASKEADLYSLNVEASLHSQQFSDSSGTFHFRPSSSVGRRMRKSGSRSASSMSPVAARFLEPMYEAFYCPLSKNIMEDPVTIESGITYDRKAIAEWFKKYEGEEVMCPVTRQRLLSQNLNTNIALKTAIEEWKERNELGRIKAAKAALALPDSPATILETITDIRIICQGKPYNRVHVRNVGLLPILVKYVEYRENRNVRSAALEMLKELAEDDDDSKEMIANIIDINKLIKLLSSSHQPTRHATLDFLLELSKVPSLCERIGSSTGAILLLVTSKYNSNDAHALAKARDILHNLESHPANVKQMAENGDIEPLLKHLIEGNEEKKQEMANYLEEIFISPDTQTYVAERAAPPLVEMVRDGNGLTRRSAFRALARISSYHSNSKVLVEAGILQIMIEEMFNRQIRDEALDSKVEAASIITNIIDSGIDLDTLQVNTHGHTISSDYIVYNVIQMMKNTTPDDLNVNLVRILLCLMKSQKSTATIVSIVKETEASFILTELVNSPNDELVIAAIKLLMMLSPHMGHTLAEKLCKTRGLPENLIRSPSSSINLITEKQAVSANFLAKLPHQNLTLNLVLLERNLIPEVLQRISQTMATGMRTVRHANYYLEGLVGTLVRFTTTLYEPQILYQARLNNFTSVFTDLLMKTSSDEVQRMSAVGLENLSVQTVNLSKPLEEKKPKFNKFMSFSKTLSFRRSKKEIISGPPLCPVHRGACSAQNTFCLVEAKAVEKLLACLDHENPEVVEAALSALSTLLDDRVDVDKSVSMLSSSNAIPRVLNAAKDHRREGLRQKSFWMIEKFLSRGRGGTDGNSLSYISQDRLLPVALVSAFHHGDVTTRQMAERILRHLNKMPYTSSLYTL
ncbi:hypothetical protein MLD38_007475 [Melastoma candidum]|uniref:Uncharacterized protein n=1 Tax=Melastoma candidum TaxID=119954 RepID=A0ACB9RQW5_9MYRT|nr:hypothetical protein MLD38_007475 [Melastoma candidum]